MGRSVSSRFSFSNLVLTPRPGRLALVAMLAGGALGASPVLADASGVVDVAPGYAARDVLTGQYVSGGFTLNGGQVHSWSNDYLAGMAGYRVGDIASGNISTIGRPASVDSNNFGDAYGAYDPASGDFYVGAASNSTGTVYRYQSATATWSTLGNFTSNYGATVRDGQLYVSGLNALFDGGAATQGSQIARFDLTGGNAHDVLVQAQGYSADLAFDAAGNAYYADGFGGTGKLYRWTAAQIAGVRADLGGGAAGGGVDDLYLTYDDATILTTLPTAASGLTVDAGGNVFVTVNDYATIADLLMWNDTMGLGDAAHYATIASADAGIPFGTLGALASSGDFLNGGKLYVAGYGVGGLAEITAVPEPGAIALVGMASLMALAWRRRRNVAQAAMVGAVMLPVATSFAGPYSPGKGGAAEAAFSDAGIAGFVGPAGEGVAATPTNGNVVNPIFKGWATGVASYLPSDAVGTYGVDGLGTQFADPTTALGPVTGNNGHAVSLGDLSAAEIASGALPGSLTLTFAHSIYNGPGADFAAFENGFVSGYSTGEGSASGQMLAELGFVEVSTDGTNFARFAAEYLNSPPANVNAISYLTQDVSNIRNLVGKHANGATSSWGTPFDLDELTGHALVTAGLVDLSDIRFVRIVDIAGNGTFSDAQGRGIYDSWMTWGSGGLDLEAVGVINQVPEPSAVAFAFIAMGGLLARRRGNG